MARESWQSNSTKCPRKKDGIRPIPLIPAPAATAHAATKNDLCDKLVG